MNDAFRQLFSQEGDLVIGTYMSPPRLFDDRPVVPGDPARSTEVIAQIATPAGDVLITRMSGLFVAPPPDLRGWPEGPVPEERLPKKFDFEQEVAAAFNMIICELSLGGLVVEPVTPVYIGSGRVVDGHAVVLGAGGGQTRHHSRVTDVTTALVQDSLWMGAAQEDPGRITRLGALPNATALTGVNANLPALVSAAYAFYSERQLPESLVDAWVVCEQLLDYLWTEKYLPRAVDGPHRERLKDSRSFTANVRAETLYAVGELPEDAYRALQLARKERNEMAHRARVTQEGAVRGMDAMKLMLELTLGRVVAPPSVSMSVSW